MRNNRCINIVELFGGIGAFTMALYNLEIDHEVVDYVEIDKNCVKSYNTLYNKGFKSNSVLGYNLPNVRVDILMHGSPCQDFSRAGKQKGGMPGSDTRSSLLFEVVKILKQSKQKPKIVVWENVKGVLDKNTRASFSFYIEEMGRMGYHTKVKVLSAMDFGIPQKRERIFAISVLGENHFSFDKLETRKCDELKNYLEDTKEEKYMVTQPSILELLDEKTNDKFKGRLKVIEKFCYTIGRSQVRVPNAGIIKVSKNRYRYLTERECFRLMGFKDKDFNKLQRIHPVRRKGCKSSILYSQAGNSIVVNILESIVKELIRSERSLNETK